MKTLIRTAENKQKGRQFDMPVLEDWLQKKIFHLNNEDYLKSKGKEKETVGRQSWLQKFNSKMV